MGYGHGLQRQKKVAGGGPEQARYLTVESRAPKDAAFNIRL